MRAPSLPCVCCKNMHYMEPASSWSAKLASSMLGCFFKDLVLLPSWAIDVACIAGLLRARSPHICPSLPSARYCITPSCVPSPPFCPNCAKVHNFWSHTAILKFSLTTVPPTLSKDFDP
ncbi:UNVERIFIED_CONTAM: hypothetical protein K2H54_036818 [Gekko kuhli]